jgi:L-ascorbate metabolism protein UlaG (beta-lactamase superfamily)
MKILWLGHGSFRIEIGDQILLVDPWINGNPMFPQELRDEALSGATQILLTHGHFDHSNDVITIAKELNLPIAGIADLMSYWEQKEEVATIGFNKGGTIKIGNIEVTMVNATHSSSLMVDNKLMYTGAEAGFVIKGEDQVLYFSGDTDVMADMEIIQDLHQPDIGILSCGGHFTMDMKRAAYAAKKYFNFSKIIPCHYKTFPLLEQNAETLIKELGVEVVLEPEVMKPIEL